MKKNLMNSKWQGIMPASFSWLENLKIAKCQDPIPGAYHVLITKHSKSPDTSFSFQTNDFPQDIQSELLSQVKTMGWKGEDPLTVMCDKSIYTLIAVSTLDVPASQKGRQIGLELAKLTKNRDVKNLVLSGTQSIKALDVFEGLAQGYYESDVFKGSSNTQSLNQKDQKSPKFPEAISLKCTKTTDEEISAAIAMAQSVTFTRHLQDAPPNIMDSEFLANITEKMSTTYGIKCNIKGRREIEELGMGAFISVANGTPIDPKLITLEVEGKDTSKTVALVGKGLTFDAGGISIKPSSGMEEMKYDMSGGAAVIGSAMFLGMVKPPVNVVCIVGAVENMPGDNATRPGDIVKAMNGKTIEVMNTDAEGRLVLVDLLHYAETVFKPDLMINIATLTGAILAGLGKVGSAIMTNDQGTADFLLGVSRETGEPFWQLPLWAENAKDIKGEFGDYKNIAAPNVAGGSILAGIFLKEFVGTTNWAHLDIAGTGWNCHATGYPKSGGSAFGLRLMSQACLDFVR